MDFIMKISTYTLSQSEYEVFEDYCASPMRLNADDVRRLCPDLAEAIAAVADPSRDTPLIVVKALPSKLTGDLPTPSDRRNPDGMDMRTEHAMALCAAMMGASIRVGPDEAFPFNTPFHHVIPQREHADTPAINNGAGDFPFHQDRIFLDDTPEYHMLAGVRLGNDPCPTAYMDTRPILEGMPSDVAAALRREEFADPISGKRVRILREGRHGDYLGVDLQPGWIDPLTAEASNALDYLRQCSLWMAQSEHTATVLIGPGDLVVHDHRRLMHGRERFKPDFAQPHTLRWLIRAHAMAQG
jgi:hypothetical protein